MTAKDMRLITDHVWRPVNRTGSTRWRGAEVYTQPCQYFNCKRSRDEHIRSVHRERVSVSERG